jgi:cytidine deaminase
MLVFAWMSLVASASAGTCRRRQLVTYGESRIHTIVAVGPDGKELPPCGRCRELIFQIDAANADTRVLLPRGKIVTLRQLLSDHWLLDR